MNGAESGVVIQRNQVIFEATLTTRTTVSIENKKNPCAPGSTALGIGGRRRRRPRRQNGEEDVRYIYFDGTEYRDRPRRCNM